MRIGIFSDSQSLYNNMYSSLRTEVSLFRKWVEWGHEVYLLSPEASPTVMKRWDGRLSGATLSDVFNVGAVIPVEEGCTVDDIDLLWVSHLVWSSQNWRNRDHVDRMLKHYVENSKVVFWRSADDEFDAKGVESYLRDYLPKKFPDIYKRIDKVFMTYTKNPLPDNDDRYINMPHVYDPGCELAVKYHEARDCMFRFGGPMGYRVYLGNIIKEHVVPLAEETGLPLHFHGEDYFAKYTVKGGFDTVKEIPASDTVKFTDGRFFATQEVYNDWMSKGIFALHDGIAAPWGGTPPGVFCSRRAMEAAYSGCALLTTPFYYVDRDTGEQKIYSIENLHNIDTADYIQKAVKDPVEFEKFVQTEREFFRYQFSNDYYADRVILMASDVFKSKKG